MNHSPFEQDRSPPSALDRVDEIRRALAAKRVVAFLDYDGTLTPIVERPELATLDDEMRKTLVRLAARCPVAIVSGRDRRDVAALVGLESLVYAGSHGFDIAGPNGLEMEHPEAAQHTASLDRAAKELRRVLDGLDGVLIEPKRYALAIHYRLVAEPHVTRVQEAVTQVAARYPDLRLTPGKRILELRPALDWDKGAAVIWLLAALGMNGSDVLPIYLGDDVTDEDAFCALHDRGIGILVGEHRPLLSHARYTLRDPSEVQQFLESLVGSLSADGAP